jgi:hypothetical protein
VLGAPAPELRVGDALERSIEPSGLASEFARGLRDWVVLQPNGRLGEELPANAAILSGSFNPVHEGHLKLAEAARAKLGVPVVFELPLVNADKAEIRLGEARRRAAQFLGRAPVVLSRAPLFSAKADSFPGSTFVVGVDTASRLLESRFYGGREARDAALDDLRRSGSRFLVAGRRRDGSFTTLEQLEVPPAFADLFMALSESEFREDLSSSQIRDLWPASSGDSDSNGDWPAVSE